MVTHSLTSHPPNHPPTHSPNHPPTHPPSTLRYFYKHAAETEILERIEAAGGRGLDLEGLTSANGKVCEILVRCSYAPTLLDCTIFGCPLIHLLCLPCLLFLDYCPYLPFLRYRFPLAYLPSLLCLPSHDIHTCPHVTPTPNFFLFSLISLPSFSYTPSLLRFFPPTFLHPS